MEDDADKTKDKEVTSMLKGQPKQRTKKYYSKKTVCFNISEESSTEKHKHGGSIRVWGNSQVTLIQQHQLLRQ